MQLLEAVVNGTSYLLSDGAFLLVGHDGFGMAPVERLEERYAQQHGATDNGFALQPRDIRIIIEAFPDEENSITALRDTLLYVFRPTRKPITLRVTRDDGSVRCIDGHYTGDMSFSSSDEEGLVARAVVTFRCADPTFYDPDMQFVAFLVEAPGSGMTFPTPVTSGAYRFPFAGPASINKVDPLVYDGSWQTYPQVEIIGPATSPIITNDATGAKLDFTGTTIAAGVSYIIDTRPERESVVDSNGVSRDGQLTNDSDLVSFVLLSNDEVEDGLNPIRVQLSGASATTAVYVRYYRRFIGI